MSAPLYCAICEAPMALFRPEGTTLWLCAKCAAYEVLVRAFSEGLARKAAAEAAKP